MCDEAHSVLHLLFLPPGGREVSGEKMQIQATFKICGRDGGLLETCFQPRRGTCKVSETGEGGSRFGLAIFSAGLGSGGPFLPRAAPHPRRLRAAAASRREGQGSARDLRGVFLLMM